MEDVDVKDDSVISILGGTFMKWSAIDNPQEREKVAREDLAKLINSGKSKEDIVAVLKSKAEGMIRTATPGSPSEQRGNFYAGLATEISGEQTQTS